MNELIGPGFFSMIITQGSAQVEYTVDLGQSQYIQSIFVLNRNGNYSRRIGDSHIRIGDDSTVLSTTNVMIVDDITDGGFFEATSLLSGRYLSIRRDSVVVYGNSYNLFCLKAF